MTIFGMFHRGPRIHDPDSPDGRCLSCGHLVTSTCATCGRELLCGQLAEVSCPVGGCLERLLKDPDHDSSGSAVEQPRRAA